jgi:hypothetical protein
MPEMAVAEAVRGWWAAHEAYRALDRVAAATEKRVDRSVKRARLEVAALALREALELDPAQADPIWSQPPAWLTVPTSTMVAFYDKQGVWHEPS